MCLTHKCGKCCHQCASGALESTRAGTEDSVFTGVVLGSAISTSFVNFASMSCIGMAENIPGRRNFEYVMPSDGIKYFPGI